MVSARALRVLGAAQRLGAPTADFYAVPSAFDFAAGKPAESDPVLVASDVTVFPVGSEEQALDERRATPHSTASMGVPYAADASLRPAPGMRVEVDGATWVVLAVKPLRDAESVLLWELSLSRGG